MAQVDPRIIEILLLSGEQDVRRLQETPILGDVWAKFAQAPSERHSLLLNISYKSNPSDVGEFVADASSAIGVSCLEGYASADLKLDDVIECIIPATSWWNDILKDFKRKKTTPEEDPREQLIPDINYLISAIKYVLRTVEERSTARARWDGEARKSSNYRTRQLTGLGLALGALQVAKNLKSDTRLPEMISRLSPMGFQDTIRTLGIENIAFEGANALSKILENTAPATAKGGIWNVTTNRRAEFATLRSVPTVKADAARQLFSVNCSKLIWAVVDSGIDGNHPGFLNRDGKSRVIATYDFGLIGRILDKRNVYPNRLDFLHETAELLTQRSSGPPSLREGACLIHTIREVVEAPSTNWQVIESLIKVANPEPPLDAHGTHVAGILGGHWVRRKRRNTKTELLGMCPDIRMIDVRVLGRDCEETEFAVIAALQFLKYLNDRSKGRGVDGINLSLSISHDVRNYACGATPVCVAAETLVANKVVVVAAAGNLGHQSFRLAGGDTYEGYAVASITDPGNAESVITVGSTHRKSPESYGVSYFSSRGPTGDGRAKPDILAPGERIRSAVLDHTIDTMDGTSMSAPHVSGAAALLMARHTDLRGNPRRIKQILSETATDIGRVREFQGAGVLDILRAMQSI